jgi:hypothetical protein
MTPAQLDLLRTLIVRGCAQAVDDLGFETDNEPDDMF